MSTAIELDRKLEKGDYPIPPTHSASGKVGGNAKRHDLRRDHGGETRPSELGARLRAGAAQESGPV